ncbi:MAG: DUF1749 domain-containing protein [Nanoarchaeota archaeon]|nr:DUF1749 domain-containing protein [Nanoarchaeota archaeon]
MKRVIIVHGWYGKPDAGWMKWLNKELTDRGIEVIAKKMPNPDNPQIEPWVEALKKIAGEIDEDTYFVGHSIGCQTILRYLESTDEKTKIGGAVFVAGWFSLQGLETDEEKETSKPWLNTPIKFDKIRPKIGKVFAVFSEDDPWVPVTDARWFKDELAAETLIENGKGHYVENEIMKIEPVLDKLIAWIG